MDNLKIINNNLDKLVFEGIPMFIEDITIENRMSDAILFSGYPRNEYDINDENLYITKRKVCLSKAISIAKTFLKMINDEYCLLFEELIKNNKFEFIKTIDIHESSMFCAQDGKDIIKIYTLGNIQDVFSIVHEFMHYTNARHEVLNEVSSYYTEAISNFIELLLTDYLIDNFPNYKKDALKTKRSIYISLYERNIETKILIELIKLKIDGKTISKYDVFNIIKLINCYCPNLSLIEEALNKTIELILEDAEDTFIVTSRDTIGIVLGSYMYELSKNKHFFKEIFELNDNLNKFYCAEVLTYLNLDLKENVFDLTNDSYGMIFKSYKKQLKNIW